MSIKQSRVLLTTSDGPPPAAVMTCFRCNEIDINEDWMVFTRDNEVDGESVGVCPDCVVKMFGPNAIK